MWVLKASVPEHKGQLIASRTKKHKISLYGYVVSHCIEKNHVLVTAIGHMVGNQKNKQAFLRSFRKDKRIKRIETKGDVIISCFKQDIHMKALYNPNIIFVAPVIANESGQNIFEIASWEKKDVQKVAQLFLSKAYSGKIISMTRKKINNVFCLHALPNLTELQKRAFEIAIQNGYYEFPRKIDLNTLASIMGVKYTTYHFHLRKAEKKIMPSLFL